MINYMINYMSMTKYYFKSEIDYQSVLLVLIFHQDGSIGLEKAREKQGRCTSNLNEVTIGKWEQHLKSKNKQ